MTSCLYSSTRTQNLRSPLSNNLTRVTVLSGNRNFEGRVHPLTRANYLASPPLVVAYALAGTVNIDFEVTPRSFVVIL